MSHIVRLSVFPRLFEKRTVLFVATLLISFASVILQISVMRLASALYIYHYAFVAVSLALLGLGLGGLLTVKVKTGNGEVFQILAELSVICSLAISWIIALTVFAVQLTFYLFMFFAFIPFFIVGFMFGIIYKAQAHTSNILYLFDLIGAGSGSLLALLLFDQLNVINTVLFLTTIVSLCSILFALSSQNRRLIVTTFFTFLFFSTILLQGRGYSYERSARGDTKELHLLLDDVDVGAKIIDTKWGLFGRTDLVEVESDPDVKIIFTDGGAATKMYKANRALDNATPSVSQLQNSSTYFPFCFGEKRKVLVIGSGGGMDVLMALMAGAEQVFAIEVNADTIELVREYAEYNGGIYTEYDKVKLFIDEGRSFLRRTPTKYDVILLNLPVTRTSHGVSAYSLAENYVFTTNAFHDYLDHLEEDGRIVIVNHVLVETYKILFTALQAFEMRNIDNSEAMKRVVIIEKISSDPRTFPLFILKKSNFTEDEVAKMHAKTIELGLTPVYFPGIPSHYPLLDTISNNEILLADAITQISTSFDLSPPSDNKPFFYKFEPGLPSTILLLLAGAAFLCALILFWHHPVRTKERERQLGLLRFLTFYFSMLGAGFMIVETTLMQQLILFLGHPTFGMAIFIFSLLVSSGVGGFFSLRLVRNRMDRTLVITLIIGVAINLFYVLIMPSLLQAVLGFKLMERGIITIISIFPLGFLMGIPFPYGMSTLKRQFEDHIPWMWCLNGVFSFLGSTLAITVAMILGFSYALLIGGLAYIIIFVVGVAFVRKHVFKT